MTYEWKLEARAQVVDSEGRAWGEVTVPFTAYSRYDEKTSAWQEISQEILVPDLGDRDELHYRGDVLMTWSRLTADGEPVDRFLQPTLDGFDCRLFSVQLSLVGPAEEPVDEDGDEQ